jgi:hypothetical protein
MAPKDVPSNINLIMYTALSKFLFPLTTFKGRRFLRFVNYKKLYHEGFERFVCEADPTNTTNVYVLFMCPGYLKTSEV